MLFVEFLRSTGIFERPTAWKFSITVAPSSPFLAHTSRRDGRSAVLNIISRADFSSPLFADFYIELNADDDDEDAMDGELIPIDDLNK